MRDVTRTVYLDGGGQTLELRKYALEVIEGPDAGLRKVFDGRRLSIGTGVDNDLTLNDDSVSRTHVTLEVTEEGYFLADADSKNGTFIQGLRVHGIYLNDGTTFRVGSNHIQFKITSDVTQVHLSGKSRFGNIIGKSVAMREIFGLLERVAPTDATVLIEGESGTGKELVAEAIHQESRRSKGPMIVVDCSAIARDLIESELFGHVKGAFTGATGVRKGAFEAAHGGTLFLDELGEMPLDLQPKLLRCLEKREVKPVGSNQTIQTDVRIVAATNRNLIHEVKEGNFREDLYYRFAVIKIGLPSLRSRVADIPLLVDHFLSSASEMAGRENVEIGYRTMEKLKVHPWKGNVRELKNFIERSVLLSQGEEIETRFLNTGGLVKKDPTLEEQAAPMAELAIDDSLPFKDAKSRLIEHFEKTYWSRLLERTGGNVSKAARIAGVHRKSVEYILKKLDIRREDLTEQ